NSEQIEAIGRDNAGVLESWQAQQLPSEERNTEKIIDRLFPGNPWLCVAQSKDSFRTLRREHLRGSLSAYSLIVPSPIDSQKGITKSGRKSYHSLANTGPRRFVIIEADCGGLDQQAAVIWHLAKYAPLAAVVFSGSKSLHAWFYCKGTSEEQLSKFMRYAVS